MTTLLDLPLDIIRSLPDLSIQDIISLSKSNRRYNQALCTNDSFWRSLARQRLTNNISIIDSKNIAELKKDLFVYERNTEKITYYAKRGYEKAVANLIPLSYELPFHKAFRAAAVRGYFNIVQILFPTLGSEQEYIINIAFEEAARGGHTPIVDFLFPYVDQQRKDSAVWQAAANGHLELLKHLFRHASEESKHSTIEAAAINDHRDIVAFLLPYSDEKYRNRGFAVAAHYGFLEIVEMLLPYITDQWELGSAALNAYWNRHHEIFRLLFPLSPEDRHQEIIDLAMEHRRISELQGLV